MTEKDKISFEDAMEQLEKIVEHLEKGDVPLEEAISYYEKGMELSKICHYKLTNVQKQMTKIVSEHGELIPFDVKEEE